MFVDGKLVTRALKGPCDFPAWKACWEVFRATMVSLMTVSPATLDGYERGISTLVALFPTQWGVIFCADEIIRSEVWMATAEDLQDKGDWPVDRPWDLVLRVTTYGGADSNQKMSHWWFTHVVAPCQRAGSPVSFIQEIEGAKLLPMPDGFTTSEVGTSSASS